MTGKSPLISCLEAGMAEQGTPDLDTEEAFETLQVLLENGWDPNQCLSDEKSKLYKVPIFQFFPRLQSVLVKNFYISIL